jgi:hypothetical protein
MRSAAYVFDVIEPFIHPIPARTGDVLVVRPGTAVPIAVVRKIRQVWTVVHVGPPNYGALLIPICDGLLIPQTPADALFWAA